MRSYFSWPVALYRENLEKYHYDNFKHIVTPNNPNLHLFPVKNDSKDVIDQKGYATIIGILHYSIEYTRPVIAYTGT